MLLCSLSLLLCSLDPVWGFLMGILVCLSSQYFSSKCTMVVLRTAGFNLCEAQWHSSTFILLRTVVVGSIFREFSCPSADIKAIRCFKSIPN